MPSRLNRERKHGDINACSLATGCRQFDEVRPVTVTHLFRQLRLPAKRRMFVQRFEESGKVIGDELRLGCHTASVFVEIIELAGVGLFMTER